VLMTAPYFHDGSQETLWDAMDHYNKGDGIYTIRILTKIWSLWPSPKQRSTTLSHSLQR
jgi:hypothetical protein